MPIWADNSRGWKYYVKRWSRWGIVILFMVFTEFITRSVINVATMAPLHWYGTLTSFWTIIIAAIMVMIEALNPDFERIIDALFGE